jgi:polar amino acid transport system substrate-binding protein
MKRFLAIILAGLMLLSLVACGAKDENVLKRGALEMEGEDVFSSEEHLAHMKAEGGRSSNSQENRICYNNLSSALMDLESGKIDILSLTECMANYVVAHNDKIAVNKIISSTLKSFSMMTTDSNTEVYDILNNAIKEMKADGTLDSLIENELKAYINSDPETKELPHFDGAKTIKIGVTGDLPPMDYVAANGKAAGFNIALLTEIANRAQVNFELVQIETGARALALSSGKVDAVFWTKSTECTKCGATSAKSIDGVLVTESYFTDCSASIKLKSEK